MSSSGAEQLLNVQKINKLELKKNKTFLGQRLTTIMLLPSLCCNPAISLVKHMLVDRGQVADLSRQE